MSECAKCYVTISVSDGCEFNEGDFCYNCLADKCDELEAKLAACEWKPITETPNPESVLLLTGRPDHLLGKSVRVAFQTTSYEWCDEYGRVIAPRWEPTHWMLFPNPPQQEREP